MSKINLQQMKNIISKAMSSGMDFTRRGALKAFLKKIDVDQDIYDRVYVTIKNMSFEDEYRRVPFEERVLFLPQCLRNSEKCKATLTQDGYECQRCGGCVIDKIMEITDELNYKKVYIVPGGSLVRKIIKKKNPRAVVGVACFLELAEAMEQVILHDLPAQGVNLIKEGCIDTRVDLDTLEEMLRERK